MMRNKKYLLYYSMIFSKINVIKTYIHSFKCKHGEHFHYTVEFRLPLLSNLQSLTYT